VLDIYKGTTLEQILHRDIFESLRTNSVKLVDLIELGYGMDRALVYKNCISRQHRKGIMTPKNGETQRNEELLNILRRRSQSDFILFMECLREFKQNHLADLILCNGGKSVNFLKYLRPGVMRTLFR